MRVSLSTGPPCSSSFQKMFQWESAVRCVAFYIDLKRSRNIVLHRALSPKHLAELFVHCEAYLILLIGSGWFIEQMHRNMTNFWIVRFFLGFLFFVFLSWGKCWCTALCMALCSSEITPGGVFPADELLSQSRCAL